ncbi:hypothetical protein [Streptomyces sp. NBC_01408]|uniref:hypothetical protein n=1 Tax=Streptomyces sp. NBC_01408 TaxID=2903855 RepID=UPI00225B24B7|nr:hypothetical protein [Streptomyces sp. NBC_01408]MCX4692809.1 hypothetical protein [Streptomyces sp. NBC_01408]
MSFLDKAAYILAPGTVFIGLLYFYGSTYTDTYYSFFGVPRGDLQFSVQGYLANSPQAIFSPVWFLFCIGVVLLMLLFTIEHVLAGPRNVARRRVVARCFLYPGLVIILLTPWVFSEWLLVGASPASVGEVRGSWAPLVVALGAALYLLGLRLMPGDWGAPGSRAPTRRRMWLVAAVVLVGTVAAALFVFVARSATAAGWSDAAIDAGKGFRGHPGVVIYSRVKIAHEVPGITYTDKGSGGGPYRFRYTGFVTLAKTPTHFYLVPRDWQSGRAVLVLPDDGTFRAEMRPV